MFDVCLELVKLYTVSLCLVGLDFEAYNGVYSAGSLAKGLLVYRSYDSATPTDIIQQLTFPSPTRGTYRQPPLNEIIIHANSTSEPI